MPQRITRRISGISLGAAIAGMWLLAGEMKIAAAAWQPPADNLFTESQLKAYIDCAADWARESAQIGQSVADAKTDAAKAAAVTNIGDKQKACIETHGLTQEEFQWLADRTIEAYGAVVFIDDTYGQTLTDLQSKSKENDDRLADAQNRLAEYQSAEKDGRRVMSSQDRDDAIKAALAERQEAMGEIQQHTDDAKAADADAKQHDDDARAANELADNPPADVSEDDRADYVTNKRAEAQAAEDAAADARSREADAGKALADTQARIDAAAKRAADPELPQTDDDKAAIKAENDAAIIAAQADINQCQQAGQQLASVAASLKQSMDQMNAKIPAQNVQLMRKYRAQYEAIFRGLPAAATQPAS
jgi:hypothetical protein